MKILIIGTGLSGGCIARLLKDRNHDVKLIEKQRIIGGLCFTKISPNGIKYEPYGVHVFHSGNPKIIKFITKFDKFNGYVHKRGLIINGKLFPLPLTKESLYWFENKDQIFQELQNRSSEIDNTNFETACISIFGETLYQYYIKNYSMKMWGMDPKKLTAEWVPKRLELREKEDESYFGSEWQGLPKNGYTFLINQIIKGIPVKLNTFIHNPEDYDIVVSSAPLDDIMQLKFGKLEYRSLKFDYKINEIWESQYMGTINLPQHPKYIRKCNFKIPHKQKSPQNWIQYQEPAATNKDNLPMYPISTKENQYLFNRYLKEVCKTKNICPIGRLGLYKYLDMDKVIEIAFDMLPIIENYLNSSPEERYNNINEIRNKY